MRKNRKKAVSQLCNTIDFFDEELNRDYEELSLIAYVCTPKTYPRANAAWNALAVEFLEDYGIPIYETDEKQCQ